MRRAPSNSRQETRPSSRGSRYSRRRDPAADRSRAKAEAAGLPRIPAALRSPDYRKIDRAIDQKCCFGRAAGLAGSWMRAVDLAGSWMPEPARLSCLERGADSLLPGRSPAPACPPGCYPLEPAPHLCGNQRSKVRWPGEAGKIAIVEEYASFYPHSAWMLLEAQRAKLLSFDH